MRRDVARLHATKLGQATSPTAFLLPLAGVGAWDRKGTPLHRPDAHAAFCEAFCESCLNTATLYKLDSHINDEAFVAKALELFDVWLHDGTVSKTGHSGERHVHEAQ